jgi:drug/metabolite transporter (DMT)-like permease
LLPWRWRWRACPWNPRLLALLVYGGTAGIALPYWAMQIVNKNLPATTTALALLVVPMVGVACSALALGEPITAGLVMAMLLIISGIAVGMSDSVRRLWLGKGKARA